MKVVIEDNSKVYIDDVLVYSENETKKTNKEKQLVELFDEYRGTTEYNGIVAEIQKWYYGFVSKTAWCSTSLSYFVNKLGKLSSIGGKAENVYVLMNNCKKCSANGLGEFFDKNNIPKTIKRNDILFWLWSGNTMNTTSSKHVGVAEYDSSTDKIFCIGGNQKDKICTLEYDKKYLFAVYRMN